MASIAPYISQEPVTAADFAGVRTEFAGMKGDFAELRAEFAEMRDRFEQLNDRFYDLQKSINDQLRSFTMITVGAMTGLTGIFVAAVSLLD